MDEIRLTRTTWKCNIYGTDFVLKKPTNFKALQFKKKMEETTKEDSEAVEKIMREMLIDCGMPDDVAQELESEHVIMIYEQLSGKKNSQNLT